MAAAGDVYRFRPQLRALPIAVALFGVGLVACVPLFGLDGASRTFAFAAGVVGPVIALVYWLAPAWRFSVEVDAAEDALIVRHGARERFRLKFADVVEVIHAPASKTCFVNGGEPARSILVPGPGAPASYRIERREELYDVIVRRVARERLRQVERLDLAPPSSASPGSSSASASSPDRS
jgi:hypothetical protein